MYKIIFSIPLVLFSLNSFAACNEAACTGKVVEFYLRNSEDIYIKMGEDISPLQCEPIGGKYITLEGSHKNGNEIYSALLAAKTINSDVTLRIVKNSTNCSIDYVQAY